MVQRWGGPEQVGAVLGALRSVELVGPKLALQVGDEEVLAKQLAELTGVPNGTWLLELVKGQGRDAYSSLEPDARLRGPPPPQRPKL